MMRTETKLSLMMSIGASRVIRMTTEGRMTIDTLRMCALVFDQDLINSLPAESNILIDIMKSSFIDRQLKDIGGSNVLVLPTEKKLLNLLFPRLARQEKGLVLIALQPEGKRVVQLERTISLDDNGRIVFG